MTNSYPKPEMDLKLEALKTEMDTNHKEVMSEITSQKGVHDKLFTIAEEIKVQATLTNGKVKKIIIALTAIGSFALGTGGESIITFFKLII